MLVDANDVPRESEVETDICIIGASPAGIGTALPLLNSGLRVTVLVGGGAEFTHSLKHPLRVLRGHILGEQGLTAGKIIGHPYYPLRLTRARGFGGTANALKPHGLRSRPLDAIDFEARPELGLPGWPISRSDLDPYYERAQDLCGLGPADYGPGYWEELTGARRLPVEPDRVETTIFQYGPVNQFRDQLSTFTTSPNTIVVLRASATELKTDPSTHGVERVEVATLGGNRFAVRAKIVVLATGAIENARLLLASREGHLNGLGNEHDLVGRYFMEHPHFNVAQLRPRDPGLVGSLALYGRVESETAPIQGFLRLPDEVLRREGLLNAAFGVAHVSAVPVGGIRRVVGRLRWAATNGMMTPGGVRHALTAAGGFRPLVRTELSHLGGASPSAEAESSPRIAINVMAEQAPHRDSRVTLGDKRDRLGMPVTQLDWKVQDSDRASLRRALELLDEALCDAGIGRLEQQFGDQHPPTLAKGGWHHMGTTRMHGDPRVGVVDATRRVHGVPNLYIAGSSVFTSGGASNPTLTLVALALRLGDHLRERGLRGSES